MNDLISRQAAIDVEGIDEQIRCEMCGNPMHTDRGCDGNCKYDEKLYERIMQILGERIKPLPSVQPKSEWKTDHGYIWLCPKCGLDVHSDFVKCPRCGLVRHDTQQEIGITRCKDCKNWISGYITDDDDFIPPKCSKYLQMVGHNHDDFCSLAERRTDGTD